MKAIQQTFGLDWPGYCGCEELAFTFHLASMAAIAEKAKLNLEDSEMASETGQNSSKNKIKLLYIGCQ